MPDNYLFLSDIHVRQVILVQLEHVLHITTLPQSLRFSSTQDNIPGFLFILGPTPLVLFLSSAWDITAFVWSSDADTTDQPWLHCVVTVHLGLHYKHLKRNIVKQTDGFSRQPKNLVIFKDYVGFCWSHAHRKTILSLSVFKHAFVRSVIKARSL